MKKWLFAILLGAILVLGACGGGGNDNNNNNNGDNGNAGEETTSAAETAYKKSCALCHGGNLNDGGSPALDKIGSKYSAEEIEDIIENGKGGMPAQKGVSESDRTEIANWLADKK